MQLQTRPVVSTTVLGKNDRQIIDPEFTGWVRRVFQHSSPGSDLAIPIVISTLDKGSFLIRMKGAVSSFYLIADLAEGSVKAVRVSKVRVYSRLDHVWGPVVQFLVGHHFAPAASVA